ncbi:hypothetical protein [Xenorhabdus lircayensis]|uniref:Uncharacterized protein n=1 Tax=Xenorhabdus lircayensis TaxID=2763499 RepID=A0ABS0U674_9GAMM|nr:hypothetical protein [Xenorhabdus lircayensis]MBI6548979.1 hypothetical protein [Xenorhabdus lircayensis]
MSYKDIINNVGERITVTLTAASGISATAIIDNRSAKTVFYGSREDDQLKKLVLRYSQGLGEETEISYGVNAIGQGIDRVFNTNTKLYLDQFGESPFRIKIIGRN